MTVKSLMPISLFLIKVVRLFENEMFFTFVILNIRIMATYTITINERTTAGKGVLALLQSLKGVVTIKSNALDESLLDIKEGRVHYARDAKHLISRCSK
jgi:hypothetical protein